MALGLVSIFSNVYAVIGYLPENVIGNDYSVYYILNFKKAKDTCMSLRNYYQESRSWREPGDSLDL